VLQSLNLTEIIILVVVLFVVLLILGFVFYSTRFKKFKPNEYVIWLRRGKAVRSGTGGSGFVWPLIEPTFIGEFQILKQLLQKYHGFLQRQIM
jgi:uncharacterized membrane protein YqiK